ncbi:DUF805 domain-containing protein [Neisseriaceae bacterium PsAf]|nr:DUF805 domain-containing protein [Neisseriaceae bacterium PsAf]
MTRRFHDLGKSGWWTAWSFLLIIIINILMYCLYFSGVDKILHLIMINPEPSDEAIMKVLQAFIMNPNIQVLSVSLIVFGILGFLTMIVYTFILAKPGTKGDNRYGPEPSEYFIAESK